MGKVLIGLVALVVGIVIGAAGALTFGVGGLVGVGVGTGLSVGICSTVRAAQEEGLLDAAQVDQILNRAARDLSALSATEPDGEVVGSAAACDRVLERLASGQGG